VSLVERGRIVRNLDQQRLASSLVDLLQHDELPNARIPARAAAVRRTLQAPRRGRNRAQRASATAPAPPAATTTPAAAAQPSTGSGRVE
jgi:hypothetical protein